MKRRIIVTMVALVMIAGTILAGCSKSANSGDIIIARPDGYKDITDVSEVAFSVPSYFSSQATAITKVDQDSELDPNTLYMYSDGGNSFLLFCMNQVMIAVQRDTGFDFQKTDDKNSALSNSGILNIWMKREGKKNFDYQDKESGDSYKLIGTVTAQAVITTDLYGDYVGKTAVISNGENEWGLFIGVPGSKYEDLDKNKKEIITNVVKSLRPNNAEPEAETEYAVQIGNAEEDPLTEDIETEEETVDVATNTAASEESVEVEIVDTSSDEELESDEKAEEDTPVAEEVKETAEAEEETEPEEMSEEQIAEEQPVPVEEVVQETPDEPLEQINPEEEKENSEGIDEGDIKEEKEVIVKAEEKEEPTEEQKAEVRPKQNMIVLDNQKKQKSDSNNAYYSDVYSMINIGDTGKLDVKTSNGSLMECKLTLNEIYIGSKAVKKINEKIGLEEIPELPNGCSWNVAKCSISYDDVNGTPTVQGKFKGLDGNNIRYLGVEYGDRIYTAFGKATKSGIYYYYYAVPIGCKDYCLVFGDGNENNGGHSAYFHVKY